MVLNDHPIVSMDKSLAQIEREPTIQVMRVSADTVKSV